MLITAIAVPVALAQSKKKTTQKTAPVKDKKTLENQKKNLAAEIAETDKLLRETRRNKTLSLTQLAVINKKIETREQLINTINREIASLDSNITGINTSIASLQADLEVLKKNYAQMIVFAYKNRNPFQRMMFLFAASDINQSYRRMKYLQQISESRRLQADKISEQHQALNEEVRMLETQKNEKKMLLGEQESERVTLAQEKDEKDKTYRELQTKEQQLKSDLAKKKQQKADIDLAIQRLIAAEAKRATEKAAEEERKRNKPTTPTTTTSIGKPEGNKPAEKPGTAPPKIELTPEAKTLGNSFADNKGSLPWPVSQGTITERFGKHPHPVLSGVYTQNNGVNIATTPSTPARAIFEGEVTGITNIPGAGWLVIVRHGEYLSVYANLEEVFVKQGDKVKVKQNIGKVITNEENGETELHFEVWMSGVGKMNPEDWLIKTAR